MRTLKSRWMTLAGLVAIVVLFGLLAAGCEDDQEPAAQRPAEGEAPQTADEGAEAVGTSEIVRVDAATFESEVIGSSIPVLVDFYADWCGPCRALHPTLEELAAEYAGRVKIVQVNVDENGDLASRYNVRGIPALFVIKGGQTVDQTVGLQSKADLARMLKKHLG